MSRGLYFRSRARRSFEKIERVWTDYNSSDLFTSSYFVGGSAAIASRWPRRRDNIPPATQASIVLRTHWRLAVCIRLPRNFVVSPRSYITIALLFCGLTPAQLDYQQNSSHCWTYFSEIHVRRI